MNSIGGERRKHLRVTAEVLIKYQSADQFFTDYMQNISSGGIFVPTHDPLPLDTHLFITFSLPDCEQPITTEGIVIRKMLFPSQARHCAAADRAGATLPSHLRLDLARTSPRFFHSAKSPNKRPRSKGGPSSGNTKE